MLRRQMHGIVEIADLVDQVQAQAWLAVKTRPSNVLACAASTCGRRLKTTLRNR